DSGCLPGRVAPAASARRRDVLVHEGDRHAALADRRGNALHRAEPDVAAGEDAGDARLEEVRVAVELPPARRPRVEAGEHVSLLVERDLRWEPCGFGICTDEDEEPTRFEPGCLAGRGIADVDPLERRVAVRCDYLRPVEHADVLAGG